MRIAVTSVTKVSVQNLSSSLVLWLQGVCSDPFNLHGWWGWLKSTSISITAILVQDSLLLVTSCKTCADISRSLSYMQLFQVSLNYFVVEKKLIHIKIIPVSNSSKELTFFVTISVFMYLHIYIFMYHMILFLQKSYHISINAQKILCCQHQNYVQVCCKCTMLPFKSSSSGDREAISELPGKANLPVGLRCRL